MSKAPPRVDFFKDFRTLQRRVETLERVTRLNNSSIDTGAIKIVDADGNTRAVVGIDAGFHGVTTYDGAGNITEAFANDGVAPNQPSVPIILQVPGGFSVAWDGKDTTNLPMPADWKLTEIHISLVSGFTPGTTTLYSTFQQATGGIKNILIGDTADRYVKLVAVDRGNNESNPSGEVHISPQGVVVDIGDALIDGAQIIDDSIPGPALINSSITTEKLTVGSFGVSTLGNGSFEDLKESAPTQAALWSAGHASAGAGGSTTIEVTPSNVNSGKNAMRVSLAGASSSYDITSDPFVVSPTTLFYVAATIKGDGVAGHNSIVRVHFGSSPTFDTADVGVTHTDLVTTTNPASIYTIYEGQFISGSAQTYARLSVVNSNVGVGSPSSGPIYVDSVVVKPVVGTTELADLAVISAKIANLAVTDAKVGSMSAGKIIAGTLSADIIVGARIKTADTGQRVELNALGFKAYNASNVLTVDIPTSGSPSFAGTITATGGAFTGTVTISSGSLATSTNTHAKRIVIDSAGVHGMGWYRVRGYSNIVLTNGSANITSASGGFSAGDVGRTLVVSLAGGGIDPVAFSGGNSQAEVIAFVNSTTVTMSLAAAKTQSSTIGNLWDAREMSTFAADGSLTTTNLQTATGGKFLALGLDSSAGDNQTFSFIGNVQDGVAMVSNPSIYINTDGGSPASDVMCIWHGSSTATSGFNGLAFHPDTGTQVLDEFSLWDAGTHPGRMWSRPGFVSLLTDQGIAITHVYHSIYTGITIPASPSSAGGFVAQTVSYPYTFAHSPSVLATVGTVASTPFPVTHQNLASMTSTGCLVEIQGAWTGQGSFSGAVLSVLAVCS